MKNLINLIFAIILFSLCFSCNSEPDVFEGTWINKKDPTNVWVIKKKGKQFIGNRISGEDMYTFESESWKRGKEGKFKDPAKHIKVLNPIDSQGTKITYIESKDIILRLPPGTTYVRKKETE